MDSKRTLLIVIASFLLLCLISGLVLAGPGPGRSYKFVIEDHPVEMWEDGKDRWGYFSLGNGTVKTQAANARKELLPLGFVEDASFKPRFRFVKGAEEVVICNHPDFYTNGSKLMWAKTSSRITPATGEWPCALIKNGPGTAGSMTGFKMRKLIHGW